VALKFPSKEATTKINDAEWEIGAFGELSPVGILQPVELDGSTVSRVSLYNKTKMEEMGMFPGAVVTIKKSGDIIPQIIKIVSRSPREAEFIAKQNFYPKNCPSCNQPLDIEQAKAQSTVHIVCNNRKCPGQNVKRLAYGISALDIKGIGESICKDLYNSGVQNIFDFFDPTKMNPQSLCNYGILKPGRQLQLILEGPAQVKKIDLYKVILSLQFDRLGDTGSRQVARQKAGVSFSFDRLEKAVVEPFKSNTSIQSLSITKLVEMMRSRNIEILLPVDIASDAITFEMTGSPSDAGYKTKDELVTFLGTKGFAHTKLKDAKLLLTDSHASSSSKMKDARKKGIKIMTYDELIATFN
jgi:DNA ligase (NAD+)